MDAIDAVVDAFVWPLRLLGIAQPAEGQLDHVPLLSIPHNAIVNHLIPALTDKEKTMLSRTCKILWQLVASTVTQLKLGQTPGTLCVASKSPRLREFTNVTSLQLTVQGWHDIGFAAPQLLLHLSTSLPKLQEVTLLDKSHEDLYEPLASTPTTAVAQAAASAASNLFHAAVHMATGANGEGVICEGCGYDTELPDLTSVLMSLLALYPGLKKLEVYTKLLSIAEVGALSRLPQLTSLTLNSEDGVAPGALCSLSQLKKLQELRLGDVDGNNPNDIDTICDMVSRLTSLHMGYCPRLQPPVLRKVRQVQMAVDKYIQEEREKAEAERKRLEFQAASIVGKAARLAASAATTVASTATSAATNAAASAATAVLPSFITGGSSSRKHDSLAEAPAGSTGTAPHLRESERMLIDSGVPAEMFEQGNTGSTALSAAAAAAPKSEGSNSIQQQEHNSRQRQGTDDQVETPAANADGAESATEDVPGDVELPAAASLYDPVRSKPITSAHFINQSATGKGVSNSPEATFRLVTELSVNIDAEEGEEILYEMSQLSLLESLLVDSTDEFSFDPGFQPFEHTTNLRKLAITMPMSLANTQSLQRCRQLRELLLCTLPRENLGKGSLSQVTRLELLDIAPSPPNADLLQAFPRITHLVIRKGADDDTLVMIGNHMTTLEHLELYRLPAGYSQTGLRGIAHLRSLKSLILELASPGTTLGDRATRQYHIHIPLVMPFTLVSEVGSEISAAAGSMGIPLLGTNPILAFAPPSDWGLINRLGFHHPSSHANNWFPSLTDLSVQGYVAAADRDLHALSHLTKVSELSMHVQRPRGIAGRVTLRGLWNLVEMSPQLAVINLSGYMETQLLVPGRVPGVGY